MSFEKELGKELRRVRLEKGWSQEQLALEAEVDRNYVSLIELGQNSPSIKILLKLCRALDIAPSALLYRTEITVRKLLKPH